MINYCRKEITWERVLGRGGGRCGAGGAVLSVRVTGTSCSPVCLLSWQHLVCVIRRGMWSDWFSRDETKGHPAPPHDSTTPPLLLSLLQRRTHITLPQGARMQNHFNNWNISIFLKQHFWFCWDNFFKKVFGGHMSFFLGHWYPCFGFLVMPPLRFKARVGSALFALRRRT